MFVSAQFERVFTCLWVSSVVTLLCMCPSGVRLTIKEIRKRVSVYLKKSLLSSLRALHKTSSFSVDLNVLNFCQLCKWLYN